MARTKNTARLFLQGPPRRATRAFPQQGAPVAIEQVAAPRSVTRALEKRQKKQQHRSREVAELRKDAEESLDDLRLRLRVAQQKHRRRGRVVDNDDDDDEEEMPRPVQRRAPAAVHGACGVKMWERPQFVVKTIYRRRCVKNRPKKKYPAKRTVYKSCARSRRHN